MLSPSCHRLAVAREASRGAHRLAALRVVHAHQQPRRAHRVACGAVHVGHLGRAISTYPPGGSNTTHSAVLRRASCDRAPLCAGYNYALFFTAHQLHFLFIAFACIHWPTYLCFAAPTVVFHAADFAVRSHMARSARITARARAHHHRCKASPPRKARWRATAPPARIAADEMMPASDVRMATLLLPIPPRSVARPSEAPPPSVMPHRRPLDPHAKCPFATDALSTMVSAEAASTWEGGTVYLAGACAASSDERAPAAAAAVAARMPACHCCHRCDVAVRACDIQCRGSRACYDAGSFIPSRSVRSSTRIRRSRPSPCMSSRARAGPNPSPPSLQTCRPPPRPRQMLAPRGQTTAAAAAAPSHRTRRTAALLTRGAPTTAASLCA